MGKRRVDATAVCCYMDPGLDALAGRALDELRRVLRSDAPADGQVDIEVTDGNRSARLSVFSVPEGVRHVGLLQERVPDSISAPAHLSRRELEVFVLAHQRRLPNAEIADDLQISVSTVRHHLRNAYSKLGERRRPRVLPASMLTDRLLERLTSRELAVALRAAHGESNAEIGRALKLSPVTVGTYLTRVYRKTRVRNRSGLAARVADLSRREGSTSLTGEAISEHDQAVRAGN